MRRGPAALGFLAACLVLALLLIFHRISPTAGGAAFALALAVFGIASRGFRR